MKNVILSTLAAVAIGTISIGAASAMPFSSRSPALGESLAQEARVVCDRNGRCYNTNRHARSSQHYYPRRHNSYNNGYYAQPYYGAYNPPVVGVGIGPFGVGIF